MQQINRADTMTESLLNLFPGQRAKIVELDGGHIFQRKLRTMGIREGKVIRVVAMHPIGGPFVIDVEGEVVAIGRGMVRRILVEVLK